MESTTTERNPDNIVEVPDETPVEAPTREELMALVGGMVEDVVKLNEFLNQTALRNHWCGDYERRITKYNRQFKVLRLEGRRSADFERWAQAHGVTNMDRRDPYPLDDETIRRAEHPAAMRSTLERARALLDLSMKKEQPRPAPQAWNLAIAWAEWHEIFTGDTQHNGGDHGAWATMQRGPEAMRVYAERVLGEQSRHGEAKLSALRVWMERHLSQPAPAEPRGGGVRRRSREAAPQPAPIQLQVPAEAVQNLRAGRPRVQAGGGGGGVSLRDHLTATLWMPPAEPQRPAIRLHY